TVVDAPAISSARALEGEDVTAVGDQHSTTFTGRRRDDAIGRPRQPARKRHQLAAAALEPQLEQLARCLLVTTDEQVETPIADRAADHLAGEAKVGALHRRRAART